MFYLEPKMPWRQTPSLKNKAIVFTTATVRAYLDHLNARFSKVCEMCKVRSIDSLKYVQEFYTPVCVIWGHFHAHKHDAAQNKAWLVALLVSHMTSWVVLGHSKRPRFSDLLPSVWSFGYMRLPWPWLSWFKCVSCKHKILGSNPMELMMSIMLLHKMDKQASIHKGQQQQSSLIFRSWVQIPVVPHSRKGGPPVPSESWL